MEATIIINTEDVASFKAACSMKEVGVKIKKITNVSHLTVACEIIALTATEIFTLGRMFESIVWTNK